MQMEGSQEGSRLPPASSSEQNATMVKQNAPLPSAFQVRPQGPPSASQRFPTNNGSGGPRIGGPQPPALRRLDSRSSLVTAQRPLGPTSPQGPPIRPQGFPQRSPQPQLFPGQTQGFPNSPGGGPPKRFPSGPPQGQRLTNPAGPRSLVTAATAGQPPRFQNNQPPIGPNSLQFNNARPQGFPQRTPSQSSIRSESPDGSRPGTPSSGGRLSTIFPQRQLMSGPEGLPPQTNLEESRETRNDLPRTDSPLQRNPSDPRNNQNLSSAVAAGSNGDEFKGDDKFARESLGNGKKPDVNIIGNNRAGLDVENLNGRQKSPINNDDDDDVVFDSDSNKCTIRDEKRAVDQPSTEERSEIKTDNETPSKSPDTSAPRTPTDFHQSRDVKPAGFNFDAKSRTPEPAKSPGPREAENEGELGARDSVDSESPTPRTQMMNLASPVPPQSFESTPGNSPTPRGERPAVPSPIPSQELEKRLSISESPEASPKSLNPSVIGFEDGNARSLSSRSPVSSSSPSPNPPKSPNLTSQSPNPSNPADSPVSAKSPNPLSKSVNQTKSPGSTPQSPNPPKSPGCLRSSEGEKSGRSTPDVEGGKKRATFAKDLIMSGTINKDDESAASTLSDLKDFELTTPEESSKGTPTTPSKGTPSTPRKSFPSSADRSRHRSRSPKSDKGKSPEKESAASRNRTARESKERSKDYAKRSWITEGDNDSGVDESTQGHELTTNGDTGSPTKAHSKIPGPKRSTSSSPTKSPSKTAKGLPKTPDTAVATSASAEKKKVPMNKIQVGAAPSPNLKTVRSKIGSLENTSYKPGGGKIKIENRKLDFSKAQPKIAAKNDKYTPSGGDKKITQVKLQWNAKPKVGSLENSTYKPGGGDKKIETVKLDFKEKAKPKVASKENVKHVPGGGTVKSSTTPPETPQKASDDIETLKIEVKAESKVGSMDNVKHKPGGGDKKIFNDKDYLRQTSSNVESLSGSGSQENHGNVVLNVISPSPARKMKKLAEAEDNPSHNGVSTPPIVNSTRPKSRPDQVPVPLTTTPVEEKKAFPPSRKSSLVKTPDRAKTPEGPKKVTIAENDEVRGIEIKKNAKSPTEKRPKTPEEKRPSTPRHETASSKISDTDSKVSTPRTKSPLKKSPSEESQKSPRTKAVSGDSPATATNKGTPRKERSSPPNSLPLNNSDSANDKMRKSSPKEFKLPKIVSNMLPELSSQDSVIPTPGSDSKIALPKLVDTPTPTSRTGVAQ